MAGLLRLLLAIATPTLANQDDQFFQSCPPTRCGTLEIRFPLRLTTSPLFCSPSKTLSLSCSPSNQTLLSLPSSPSAFAVTAIDYSLTLLTVDAATSLSTSCPLQNQTALSRLTAQFLSPIYARDLTYISCTNKLNLSATPIPCLGGAGRFGYAVLSYENIDLLPEDCVAVETGGRRIPLLLNPDSEYEYETYDGGREISLRWSVPGISDRCVECEVAGKQCGFRPARNQTFCRSFKSHGQDVKLIAGTSSAGLIILLSVLAFFYLPI